MISRKTLALSCSAVLVGSLAASPALAQDVDVKAGDRSVQVDRGSVELEGRNDRQSTQPLRQRPRAGEDMDRQIAQWLIIDQQNIVNLAQYGLQRTETPQVRALAETIVRDHEAFARKLSETGSRNSDNSADVDSADAESADASRDLPRGEQREAIREARRDVAREEDGDGRVLGNLGDRLEDGVERLADSAERVVDEARDGLDRAVDGDRSNRINRGARWIDIHREITRKVEEVARQDLQKRRGYEFDAAFVGMLVASHLQQEATLDVLSSRASGDLAQTLEQSLATVKQHRAQAEQVMGQINR